MNLIVERIFIAVLLLSISGFVFCAIFLPFERYAYKLSSAKTMVFCNKVALFSFLTPLYFMVTLYDHSEEVFLEYDVLVYKNASYFNNFVNLVREWGFVEYWSTIWLIGAAVYLISTIWKYYYLLHSVNKNKVRLKHCVWESVFDRLKTENKVDNISLIASSVIASPCTIGMKEQYIVIPAYMVNLFEAEEIEMLLKHEFYHIARRDIPRKILVRMLNCLNWFNPLYILLRDNLSEWIETACDEAITKDFTIEQRLQYCRLLVKVMELESDMNEGNSFRSNFVTNNLKDLKRRMERIMKKNGNGTFLGKAVVASVTLVCMFSGNVVAKAADVPVNMLFSENVKVAEIGEYEELEIGEYEEVELGEFEILEEADYKEDSFEAHDMKTVEENYTLLTTDELADASYEMVYEGVWQKVAAPENSQADAKHAHQFVSTTLKKHVKNSDGSCTTTYYDGKKCTGCDTVWIGDLIRTVTDTVCTH